MVKKTQRNELTDFAGVHISNNDPIKIFSIYFFYPSHYQIYIKGDKQMRIFTGRHTKLSRNKLAK